MAQNNNGGYKAEEAVRAFFLQIGYFPVRNIKFRFNSEEVTDLDLWAYGVGSPTHRSRVIVDCKYKIKHAQVFERILWVEGLRRAVGVEHAVVATTDRRKAASAFASRLQIRIIGSTMLDKLIAQNAQNERFSDEEFLNAVIPQEDKLVGRFKERIDASKSRLLRLDFDSVNLHIEDLLYYAQESTRLQDRTMVIRLFYLSLAFLLITLDFVLRDAVFLDEQSLRERIDEGIRFGSRGRANAFILFNVLGKKKKIELIRAVERVRADVLADFFCRFAREDWFLQTALAFEEAAYHKSFIPVGQLSASAQSVVGILLDFLQVDRHTIFGVT
ncbi:MAG: hypothetical protein AB1500_08540 [Bacillota bacterium]